MTAMRSFANKRIVRATRNAAPEFRLTLGEKEYLIPSPPAFKRSSGSSWTRTALPTTSGTYGIEEDYSALSGLWGRLAPVDPGLQPGLRYIAPSGLKPGRIRQP